MYIVHFALVVKVHVALVSRQPILIAFLLSTCPSRLSLIIVIRLVIFVSGFSVHLRTSRKSRNRDLLTARLTCTVLNGNSVTEPNPQALNSGGFCGAHVTLIRRCPRTIVEAKPRRRTSVNQQTDDPRYAEVIVRHSCLV